MKEVDRRHACSLITAWSFLRRRGADPNRDPNAEKSSWIQADTVDRPPSRKHAKAPESVAAQRFPALIVSSHAGGHWLEPSSLYKKFLISKEIRNFFVYLTSNSDAVFSRFLLDSNAAPKAESTEEDRTIRSSPIAFLFTSPG